MAVAVGVCVGVEVGDGAGVSVGAGVEVNVGAGAEVGADASADAVGGLAGSGLSPQDAESSAARHSATANPRSAGVFGRGLRDCVGCGRIFWANLPLSYLRDAVYQGGAAVGYARRGGKVKASAANLRLAAQTPSP